MNRHALQRSGYATLVDAAERQREVPEEDAAKLRRPLTTQEGKRLEHDQVARDRMSQLRENANSDKSVRRGGPR